MTRAVAILNPAAGRGAALRAWDRAAPVLRSAGWEVELRRTEAPGHATELAAAAAAEGREAVLAIGGDGTINEVASGLLGAALPEPAALPLGILPGGSGNDFIKQLGISLDARSAAELLPRASVRLVDAGRVGAGYFMNGVGVGFDARVAMAAREIRRLRGSALYGLALLRVLRRFRAPAVRVMLDGLPVAERKVSMVTIANGPCCGGGFWLCPDARLDDAQLDVLILDAMPRRRLLGALVASMRRSHVGRDGIEMRRARAIEVSSDESLAVHADGQVLAMTNRVVIEILPRRLAVLAA